MQIPHASFFDSTRLSEFHIFAAHNLSSSIPRSAHIFASIKKLLFFFEFMNLLRNFLAFQSRCWNVFKRKQLKLLDRNYLQLPPKIIPCFCHLSIVCFASSHFVEMKFPVKLAENMSLKDRNNRKQLCNNDDEAQTKSLKPDRQNLKKFENLILFTTKKKEKKKKKLEVSANITFHKDASKHKRDLLCSLTDNYFLFGSILRLPQFHSARSNRDCPENRKSYQLHQRFNGFAWRTHECELAS